MRKKIVLIIFMGVFVFIQSLYAQTWDPVRRLTWSSSFATASSTASDSSGTIHLVWQHEIGTDSEIFHKKSTDEGKTWTPSKRLTWNPGISLVPVISIDTNDNIHVVCFAGSAGAYEIYYVKSTNGGTSWSTKRLTWSTGSHHPSIVIDSSDNIHVVWTSFVIDNWEIYYKKSTDGGNNWTASRRLTWTPNSSDYPDVAVESNGNIHVVWYEFSSDLSFMEIFHKKSTNGGTSWSTKRLTWNSGYSRDAKIEIDSSNHIHVVWHDSTPGNNEIFYKRSTNGGAAWITKRLSWTYHASYGHSITTDSNSYIYVVWHDFTPGNNEIFYKKSMDGGVTWTTKRLTWNSGDSYYPAVAVDTKNNVHVFWEDATSGSFEIYYRRGKQ